MFRPSRSGLPQPHASNRPVPKTKEHRARAYVFDTIPANRGLIDMNDPREICWWRKQFGCSEEQLRRAVAEVGNSAAKVEQLLDGSEIVSL